MKVAVKRKKRDTKLSKIFIVEKENDHGNKNNSSKRGKGSSESYPIHAKGRTTRS